MSDKEDLSTVKTVLIVEDDQGIGTFILHAILDETSHQAILASDGRQAIETVKTVKPNLFFV